MTTVNRRQILGAMGALSVIQVIGSGETSPISHVRAASDEDQLFSALSDLPPEGGTIFLDGEIEISRTVDLQAGQRLVGYGSGIPVANQHPHPDLDGTRRVPSGLKPARGVTLEWVVRIVGPETGKQIWAASLQDLSIDNPNGGGILIENAKDILVQDCGISRCGIGVKLVGSRCYNIRFLGCLMQANRDHAIWIARDSDGKGADKIHVIGGNYQSHRGPSVFRVDGGQCHAFRDFQTGVGLNQARNGQGFVVFALSGNTHGVVIDTIYSENILQPIVDIPPDANVGCLVIQNLVVHGVLPECSTVLALGNSAHISIVGGYVRKWKQEIPTLIGGTEIDNRGLVTLAGSW